MKNLPVISLVLVGLLAIGITIFVKTSGGVSELSVDAKDQTCALDTDCTRVIVTCSDCDCGQPIAAAAYQKFMDDKLKRCENYVGGICDVMCPNEIVRCVENKCVLVANS